MSYLSAVVFATCLLVVCHSLPPTVEAEAPADAQTDNDSLQKQLAELKDTWQAFQRTYTRLQNDMREVNVSEKHTKLKTRRRRLTVSLSLSLCVCVCVCYRVCGAGGQLRLACLASFSLAAGWTPLCSTAVSM